MRHIQSKYAHRTRGLRSPSGDSLEAYCSSGPSPTLSRFGSSPRLKQSLLKPSHLPATVHVFGGGQLARMFVAHLPASCPVIGLTIGAETHVDPHGIATRDLRGLMGDPTSFKAYGLIESLGVYEAIDRVAATWVVDLRSIDPDRGVQVSLGAYVKQRGARFSGRGNIFAHSAERWIQIPESQVIAFSNLDGGLGASTTPCQSGWLGGEL